MSPWTAERQAWAEKAPSSIQADLLAAHRRAMELLEEVLESGMVPTDSRIRWLEIQMDRETWDAICAFVSAYKGQA